MNDIQRGVKVVVIAAIVLVAGLVVLTLVGAVAGREVKAANPAREMWTPVETPAQGGWRFFKIGVEMR